VEVTTAGWTDLPAVSLRCVEKALSIQESGINRGMRESRATLAIIVRFAHFSAMPHPGSEAELAPWFVPLSDEDEIAVMAGGCYVELDQPTRAIPLLTDVLERYDERRTRESTLYTSWLAQAHLQAGDLCQFLWSASATNAPQPVTRRRPDTVVEVHQAARRYYADGTIDLKTLVGFP
jgi:hypothetical protein